MSARSTSASSIFISWESYPEATSYLLDARKTNSTDRAPIILVSRGQLTERTIQGLNAGTEYIVTLKVVKFLSVDCVTSVTVTTGKSNKEYCIFLSVCDILNMYETDMKNMQIAFFTD